MISPAQCRAARGLVDWSTVRLAEQTGVPVADILLFEQGEGLDANAVATIKRTLEDAGAVFLPERGGRGAGARLKFSKQTVKRIDIWENEGGPAGDDDVG